MKTEELGRPLNGGTAWQDALAAQEERKLRAAEEETRKYGEGVMSEFDNIVTRDRQKKAEARRMKDATLSALMLHARNGDGFVPPSLLEAASRNMGFPVAGGNFDESGNFLLYTVAKGRDGRTQFTPAAIASPEMQFRTLSRAQMGIGMQRDIYGRLSERYTPSQLEKAELRNPDLPVSNGETVMRGGTARRLGASILGQERRGISAFGADGKGGFTNYENNADTGFRTVREDYGTRADNGVRFEKSEKERIADANNAARLELQNRKSDASRAMAEMNSDTMRYKADAMERIADADNAARLELQNRKSDASRAMAEMNSDTTRYKADAMERIAMIRANAKGGGSGSSGGGPKGPAYKGKDLKDVVDILTNSLADDETKKAARNVLIAMSNAMGGVGTAEPAAGDDEPAAQDEQPAQDSGFVDSDIGVGYFYPKDVRTAMEQAGQMAQPQTTATRGGDGGNRTARQEPPNGQYKVQKDGISYHWGKSKSGKWGYFPDK